MATKVLQISELHPNPLNPRKDLGDLTELTASIRAIGVLQNLTVFPDIQGYTVLIGHRRLAAAREAGLTEVPCVIVKKPDEVEQIAVMLQENMQREGLTIPEEADGFQMVLDLGGSVKDLAKTTGFSEGTIRNRLAVHKVDRNILMAKEWQLQITDYIELAKIKNDKTRNEILQRSYSSTDLKNRVGWAMSQEQREEKKKKVIEWAESKGFKEADDTKDLDSIKSLPIYYDGKDPEETDLSIFGPDEEVLFVIGYDRLTLFVAGEREEEEEDPEETYREKAARLDKETRARIKDFFRLIFDGKIQIKDDDDNKAEMKQAIFTNKFGFFSEKDIVYILFNEPTYSEKNKKIAQEKKISEVLSFKAFKLMSQYNGLPELKWANDAGRNKYKKVLKEFEHFGFETPAEIKAFLEEKHE